MSKYEVELRSLVDDFQEMRFRLEKLAKPEIAGEREVTVFFQNPHKKGFDLRLRMGGGKAVINLKDSLEKSARKETETAVADAESAFEIFKACGFEVGMIVAREKYVYRIGEIEVLLNRVADWGDALEAEIMIDDPAKESVACRQIEAFMKSQLGLSGFLEKEDLISKNKEYQLQFDFETLPFNRLEGYLMGKCSGLK